MATTGVINGTDLRVYVNGETVGYSTSCSMSLSAETLSTIHKDSPGTGWVSNTIGQKSGTITFESFVNEDSATQTPGDIFTLFSNETLCGIAFKTATSGDTRYDCSGYITSFEQTAPVEENSTFSGTITISGAVTKTTVT